MNLRAWHCWFRAHEYQFKEVGLDPKAPGVSAELLDFFSQQLGGHRIGFNICQHCGRREPDEPVILNDEGGTITLEGFAEKRYRDGVDELVRKTEEEHGGEVRINVPSLSAEPIPLRDALNMVTELDIAAAKAERGQQPSQEVKIMAQDVARKPTPRDEVQRLAREKRLCVACVKKHISLTYSAAEADEVDVVMGAMALEGFCPMCGANRVRSS